MLRYPWSGQNDTLHHPCHVLSQGMESMAYAAYMWCHGLPFTALQQISQLVYVRLPKLTRRQAFRASPKKMQHTASQPSELIEAKKSYLPHTR